MGDPANDYFPGAPGNPTVTQSGFGPNTRQIMRFNVIPATSRDVPLKISTRSNFTDGLDPFLVPANGNPITNLRGFRVRQLTLNESFDGSGRLLQNLGTSVAPGNPADGFGRAYGAAATETPRAGSTEVWQIANLTGDTHPIHFHLVNVQIMSRQPFDANAYNGTPVFLGPARGPEVTELGWKETVKMNPGEVTTVIMRFDLPRVPFTVPSSPAGGYEYVWHCHILEHEEHDMMRPLLVL
jgi:spore coat protein A